MNRKILPSQKKIFPKTAILGLGLMGGSLGMELRSRHLSEEVRGYNRSLRGRKLALSKGGCDRVFSTPEAAVADADLVVMAIPVQSMLSLAKTIAPHLKSGAIVTDLGSTKEKISKEIPKILGPRVTFIGGHPIAGTENSGMEAAQLNLFANRWWLFTPQNKNPKNKTALRKLTTWAQSLEARVEVLTPRLHDELLAAVSHLPHMLAFSMMDATARFHKGKALSFAGSSFLDLTRVAKSSPQMWEEICQDNAKNILKTLENFQNSLNKIKKLLQKKNGGGLLRFFTRVQALRRQM